MDEVIIKGIKYISSKRAAKMTGYAKDYIGQLVRLGKLKATKVGRAWFIEERALIALTDHTANQHGLVKFEMDRAAEVQSEFSGRQASAIASVRFPPTWSEIKYMEDKAPLFANSDSRESLILNAENAIANSSSQDGSVRVSINTSRGPSAHAGKLNRAVSARSIDGIRISVHENESDELHNSALLAEFEAFRRLRLAIGPVAASQTSTSPTQQILRLLVSAALVALVGLVIPIFG